MRELVEYIVSQFLGSDAEFIVEEVKNDETTVNIVVKLRSEDMGKVIGKQGKIAKAIRTIVKAASAKESVKYLVEITELNG